MPSESTQICTANRCCRWALNHAEWIGGRRTPAGMPRPVSGIGSQDNDPLRRGHVGHPFFRIGHQGFSFEADSKAVECLAPREFPAVVTSRSQMPHAPATWEQDSRNALRCQTDLTCHQFSVVCAIGIGRRSGIPAELVGRGDDWRKSNPLLTPPAQCNTPTASCHLLPARGRTTRLSKPNLRFSFQNNHDLLSPFAKRLGRWGAMVGHREQQENQVQLQRQDRRRWYVRS